MIVLSLKVLGESKRPKNKSLAAVRIRDIVCRSTWRADGVNGRQPR